MAEAKASYFSEVQQRLQDTLMSGSSVYLFGGAMSGKTTMVHALTFKTPSNLWISSDCIPCFLDEPVDTDARKTKHFFKCKCERTDYHEFPIPQEVKAKTLFFISFDRYYKTLGERKQFVQNARKIQRAHGVRVVLRTLEFDPDVVPDAIKNGLTVITESNVSPVEDVRVSCYPCIVQLISM